MAPAEPTRWLHWQQNMSKPKEEGALPDHWLFTCNPKRWDVWRFLGEGRSLGEIHNWTFSRRSVTPALGDDAALWITGCKRGVYAVGKIDGHLSPGSGGDYWMNEDDHLAERNFVPLNLCDLSDDPIEGAELKADPRFADATIITFPTGANPHKLNDVQWQAIEDRLPGCQ